MLSFNDEIVKMKKNPGEDLQKRLLVESLSKIKTPGWGIFSEGTLLALKSPSPFPFVNMTYGEVSPENFKKAREFYSHAPFMWYLKEGQRGGEQLAEWGLKGLGITPEMVFDLSQYSPVGNPPEIEIRNADTSAYYQQWVAVAAEWIGVDKKLIDGFFTPWIQSGGYTPFLGSFNGEPAATSLLYCGDQGAAIYCLGTRPSFRLRGLGTAMTHVCLEAAKSRKIQYAVLYANAMSRSLYERIGFHTAQTLYEFSFEMPAGPHHL